MFPARTRTVSPVERFFQFSLLGLVASGYFALAASGTLDRPTLVLTFIALAARALAVAGLLRIEIPHADLIADRAGVHCFLPFRRLSDLARLPDLHGARGLFPGFDQSTDGADEPGLRYTGAISFIELVAAALVSARPDFFVYLGLYVIFAIAAFMSAEIRRGMERHHRAVSPSQGRVAWRLAAVAMRAGAGILVPDRGLFLLSSAAHGAHGRDAAAGHAAPDRIL